MAKREATAYGIMVIDIDTREGPQYLMGGGECAREDEGKHIKGEKQQQTWQEPDRPWIESIPCHLVAV